MNLEQGSQPVGCNPFGVKKPFHWGHLRLLENTEIYFMTHNNSKTIVTK